MELLFLLMQVWLELSGRDAGAWVQKIQHDRKLDGQLNNCNLMQVYNQRKGPEK